MLKNEVEKAFVMKGRVVSKRCDPSYILRHELIDLVSRIESYCSFLDEPTSLGKKIKIVLEGIQERPTCHHSECENPVPLSKANNNIFDRHCSKSCAAKTAMKEMKQQLYTKYNVDAISQIPGVSDKRIATNIEKYGCAVAANTTENVELRKKRNLEKYGNEFHTQSEYHKNKVKSVLLDKYGVDNISKYSPIQNLKVEKYNSLTHKEKEAIVSKRRETIKEKYGTEVYLNSNHAKKRNIKTSRYRGWREREDEIREAIEQGITGYELASLLGFCNPSAIYNTVLPYFKISTDELNRNNDGRSYLEKELEDYIREVYKGEVVSNDRKYGIEFDIFIPEKNIAVEFNGNYWHSHVHKSRLYHRNKTEIAEENGVHLIHVYEYEWLYKKELVKKVLLNKLTDNGKGIGARETRVVYPNLDTVRRFLNENHIDGFRPASVYIGLEYKNELVFCASFSPRDDGMELIRMASTKRVLGGIDKVVRFLGYKKVFSFANRSRTYRTHNVYTATGFEELNVTRPNYVYVKGAKILSRYQTMKHKLPKLLENFDPNLSERKNMLNDGWLQIHDSGQILYMKEY